MKKRSLTRNNVLDICFFGFMSVLSVCITKTYICYVKALQKIENPGTISDGYHTFNDLYEQRMILFSTIVNLFPDISWKTRCHEDGKPCFPDSDYFLVTIETPTGNYGYHFDSAHWDHFQCKEIDKAKPWDGYTDKDAWRLWSLIKMKEETK